MTELKTRVNDASVPDHIGAIADEARRADCRVIARLMSRVTGAKPRMWGDSIVGFGRYRYAYASGREGEWPMTAFASRKGAITVYLMAAGSEQDRLLARLGRHRMGKSCLYVRSLGDVDVAVLERLVAGSVAEVRRRYG